VTTRLTEFEDKIVETLRDLQRPVLDVVRKGVERAEGRVPKLSYPTTFPKPGELLDSQVTFAKALFDVQRDFARGFVDAVSPLVESDDDLAATPAPASTPATPAAKAPKAASKRTPKK
jgi:hypothetical protein